MSTAVWQLPTSVSRKDQGDVDITLCLPKPWGDEDHTFAHIVAMNCVPIAWRDVNYDYVKQRIGNLMSPEEYYHFRDHIYADFNYMNVNDLGCMDFAGGYPANLHDEINNYSIIAGVVARSEEFDIIHAHDWLTYPAGIYAKQVSGKPLCIHVHATDYDRSRGHVNPTVYGIEKDGMDHADCIMCVSDLTRNTVINQYHQDPRKVFTVHNAVYPLSPENEMIPRPDHTDRDKIVTFLGRITMQKGPEYFVEAANMVLHRTRHVRFCMAGSGDMMDHPSASRLSKPCSAARRRSSPNRVDALKSCTTASRSTTGTFTPWLTPSTASATTQASSTICKKKGRKKWRRSRGRKWDDGSESYISERSSGNSGLTPLPLTASPPCPSPKGEGSKMLQEKEQGRAATLKGRAATLKRCAATLKR